MESRLKFMKAYGVVIKSWFVNLSVAAMAIGLFQDKWIGIPVGLGLFVLALLWVFFEDRYIK